MKRISFSLIISILALTTACQKEVEIGDPITIEPDYVLPQGDAPQAVNDRIQQLYDKYGSYFLYNYTQKDVLWIQYAGTASYNLYVISMGETQYVNAMLDLLHDVWLQFFPDEILKKGGIPYRVFLADQIYWDRSSSTSPGWHIPYTFKISGRGVSFAGMNEDLLSMTAADKIKKKNEWIKAMWDYYLANGILTFPNEFYELSDYTTTPEWPLSYSAANTPENRELYYKRGFLPNNLTSPNGWATSTYMWSSAKSNDLSSFMTWLLQATDEQIEPYLTNPDYTLIQEKWNFLVNYYKEKHNLDIRKIGNITYE